MFRRAFWVIVALFPILAFALVWAVGPDLIDELIASPPARYDAISDWLLAYWWFAFGVAIIIHMLSFAIHPFFNRYLIGWISKIGWALVNFFTWPFGGVIYVLIFTDKPTPHTQESSISR